MSLSALSKLAVSSDELLPESKLSSVSFSLPTEDDEADLMRVGEVSALLIGGVG